MKHKIGSTVSLILTRFPIVVGITLLIILSLSIWRVQKLEINYDQIELMPGELNSIKASKEMIDLVGGVGFFLLALKSDDVDHMKAVSDELAGRLEKMPEVRSVTYKQKIDFFKERVPFLIKTEDLEEGYSRVRKKIRSILNKKNPFSFSLRKKKKEEEVNFDDLIEKYKTMNKRQVDDPYYVDPKKEMLMMVIKPMGDPTDIDFTRDFVKKIDVLINNFNEKNQIKAVLKEGYNGLVPGATVTYGYTGGYKRNLDDSETIRAALVPTSIFAFTFIFLYLVFFLRRLTHIIMIMGTLVGSVVLIYGFCEISIGELDTITTILAAILMGFGIDFGIHFMYRFREEFTRTGSLNQSIRETLIHSGAASAASAFTTAAALYILMISDFKAFSRFGFLTGTGILITAFLMYTVLPVMFLLIDKIFPNFKNSLIIKDKKTLIDRLGSIEFTHANKIVIGSVVLFFGLLYFATQISFDYDARSLMTADRPSVVLQEEINKRYTISSDPAGVYTDTLEEAKALYEKLTPIPKNSTMDSVISIFTMIPANGQFEANREILLKIKERVDMIPPDLIEDEYKDKIKMLEDFLKIKPFGIKDIPEHIISQFRPVPGSKKDGYLTFIYPTISIWDGEALIRFAKEIGTTKIDGNEYHAAGMAVIFADLAEMVLRDGRRFIIFAAIAILIILLVVFRKIRVASFALLPLIMGMIWMVGLMDISGWHINFMNIVVFPVVFGYGVSSGIHLIHRYIESDSVSIAVHRTGSAVAASSITTLMGWAALLVSQHRGLESMGILACFGIAGALIVSLVVMPSMIQVTRNYREKKGLI